MLDRNHPQTEHVFRASGLLGGLGDCANRMSVGNSDCRSELLPKALARIDELSDLTAEQFANSKAIPPVLDQLADAFRELAGIGDGSLSTDASDGNGPCPAYGESVMKFDAMAGIKRHSPHWVILYRSCTTAVSSTLRKLETADCFFTSFI